MICPKCKCPNAESDNSLVTIVACVHCGEKQGFEYKQGYAQAIEDAAKIVESDEWEDYSEFTPLAIAVARKIRALLSRGSR